MRKPILFILCTLSLLFVFTTAQADGVKGKVVDDATGKPIADASVELIVKYYGGNYGSSTSTDSLGCFEVSSYV
jgi:hypothetical protein